MFKTIGITFGVIVLLIMLAWGSTAMNLLHFQFFAPKMEAVKREVFEQTPSYVRGKEQHLTSLCLEYARAEETHKNILKTVILLEASEVDENRLSSHVNNCLANL